MKQEPTKQEAKEKQKITIRGHVSNVDISYGRIGEGIVSARLIFDVYDPNGEYKELEELMGAPLATTPKQPTHKLTYEMDKE